MNEDDNTDSRFNRRFIAGLTVLLVVFACAYVWQLTFGMVPEANTRFADTALGFVLGTVLATPIAFWMGHSRSNTASPPGQPVSPPENASGTIAKPETQPVKE